MLNEENMLKHLNDLSDETIDDLAQMLWIATLSKADKKHFEEMVWKVKLARGNKDRCLVKGSIVGAWPY